jgi:hypothetical protein
VIEQLSNRDGVIPVGVVREMAVDLVVQPQSPLLHQLQHCDGGDGLGHRVRHQRGIEGHRFPISNVSPATGILEESSVGVDNQVLQARDS